MPLYVGTSGWQYRDWRVAFYPEKVPVSTWLEQYATRFLTVENNGTFYRLPAPDTFAAWRARTPAGFLMAVKASRYLTHVRRLREPAEPVNRLLRAATALGDRLGPVLLQLPPTMQADAGVLNECLAQFSAQFASLPAVAARRLRVCVEFRHDSWFTPEISGILTAHDAALCWSDRCARPLGPLWRTASFGYIRFHEGAARRWPRYGPQALRTWLSRVSACFAPDAEVFAYFNNDQHAAAPADAAALIHLAERAGWPVAQIGSGASAVPATSQPARTGRPARAQATTGR